jgi:antitoxin VapB
VSLNIKSEAADRLARELAALTGESITEAVTNALSERLERRRRNPSGRRAILNSIRRRVSRMPRRDTRSDDEILGYDEDGLLR